MARDGDLINLDIVTDLLVLICYHGVNPKFLKSYLLFKIFPIGRLSFLFIPIALKGYDCSFHT